MKIQDEDAETDWHGTLYIDKLLISKLVQKDSVSI